jgi:hypothetical protein
MKNYFWALQFSIVKFIKKLSTRNLTYCVFTDKYVKRIRLSYDLNV